MKSASKVLLLLLSAPVFAWSTTYTVKAGGGGNYTTIQACATAMAPGDTCTVYAGTYNEHVTVPAGTAGNYKTITVNGSDVVTVQSFTLGSHTKLIGNCSSTPSAINTCGFNIQSPSSPSAARCVSAGGSTDVYIRNNVMYACGSQSMLTATGASYVYIQGNTLSYACTTQSQAGTVKECNGIFTSGDHILVEGNDVSHVTYNDWTDASYTIWRDNTVHDLYETEAGGNGHTDAFYASTNTGSNYDVFENNLQYHDVGANAKGLLNQAIYSPCNSTCSTNLIYRYNTINGIGSGNTSTYGWRKNKVYNNTFVNSGQNCGGCAGGVDNYFQATLNTSDINNIFYFGFPVTVTGMANPVAADGSSSTGTWGHSLAYCAANGGANCSLFSHVYEQGSWTNDPGNILGYQDHVPTNNPNFVNLAGGDFHLQLGSPAIATATYLTTTNGSASNSTSLVVNDVAYFQDGYGLSNAYSTVSPDCIAVGTASNHVCVTAVNYSTNTLTLVSPISWSSGQGVYLYSKSDGAQVLTGPAPDMGAYPYVAGVQTAPTSLAFGNQAVGTTSPSQTVTLTNNQALALTGISISIIGSALADYAEQNNCGSILNANGGSCTITVNFTPTATGPRLASIQILDSALVPLQSFSLSGTGVGAGPITSYSSTALVFGNQNITAGSAAKTIVLTNTGNSNLTSIVLSFTGTNASEFSETSVPATNCGGTLAPNAACTISVVFTPAATGAKSANLSVASNAASSPDLLSLTGTGVDPAAPNVVQAVFCGPQTFPGSCRIAATTAGNLLAVAFDSYNNWGTSATITGVTDNASGGSSTWAQVSGARSVSTLSGSGYFNDIWYAAGVAAGITSITVTPSASGTANVMIWEVANVNTVDAGAALNSQASTTTPAGASVATTGTKEIILATLHPDPSGTPSGVTAPFVSDSVGDGMAWAHYVPPSTGSFTPSWIQSPAATYAASTAAFKYTSGAGVPATLSSLQCTPAILGSGGISTCTLTLSGPAPSGGAVILLSSNQAVLTVPTSATVPSGATTITFQAQAGTVSSALNAVVTATYNGISQTATIQLLTQESVSALVCSPAALTSLVSTTCTVALTFAPTAGTQVALSSNNPILTVPVNVTVPAGSTSVSFVGQVGQITANQIASITASLSGTSQSASLSLNTGSAIGLQSFGNQSVNGSYFFRQVSVLTDITGAISDARSLLGTMTFDGAGHYTYSGQLMQGTTLSSPSGSGAYTVDPAGMVTLDNPVRSGEKVNARYSLEAIVGSTSESTSTDYDLFVAIPAPTTAVSTSSLSGSYWVGTLDFSGPSFASADGTLFNLTSTGSGAFQPFTVTGHAANLSAGQIQTQSISTATYSLASDGSGTAVFGATSSLINGQKVIYLSQDGNIFIGGSTAAGAHDFLIGIKATAPESNASFSGAFWSAGLRQSPASVRSFVGSAVASGSGNLYWTRRLKTLGTGNLDFTEVDPYSINTDGSGNSLLPSLALGASGNAFLGVSVSNSDPAGFELYLGVRMDSVVTPQGTGVSLSLNPQGVQNAASYAPTGNPIAPGELIYLYVSGLTVTQQTAVPPYPLSLAGVTVMINGARAPLYLVSPQELVAIVPYATTGPTASIVVQSNSTSSNTITVPVAATAPGVFSQPENGSGLGAIRHVDYSAVTPTNPARSGEVVLIYLTGLGAINPPLADGTGSTGNPLNLTVAQPSVLVGGQPATVLFSGMSTYPGLYQINAQLPTLPAGSVSLPLAISTSNAYTEEVNIAVQP